MQSTVLRRMRDAAIACATGMFFCAAATGGMVAYSAVDLYTLTPTSGGAIKGLENVTPTSMGLQAVGAASSGLDPQDAALWTGPGAPAILAPGSPQIGRFRSSLIFATDGPQQVGHGVWDNDGNEHALLWSGTGPSAVDLNPGQMTAQTYFYISDAYGIGGSQQVGDGYSGDQASGFHAMLWTGTAASAVDLTPKGAWNTVALATDGAHQVGYGSLGGSTSQPHALLWGGSAASVIDLNPTNIAGAANSQALAIGGGQEVGYVGINLSPPLGGQHAVLWLGRADSAIDLNPAGFTGSAADATNGITQAGYGWTGTNKNLTRALAWSGSADSAVDLQSLLPAAQFTTSRAYGVDGAGDVFGIAFDSSRNAHVIEWIEVPEPSCLGVLAFAAAALLRRRRSISVDR